MIQKQDIVHVVRITKEHTRVKEEHTCTCIVSFTAVCLMLVGVVLLLLLLVGSYIYCDHLKSPTQPCSYWRENISGANIKEWTEQLMQFIGLS